MSRPVATALSVGVALATALGTVAVAAERSGDAPAATIAAPAFSFQAPRELAVTEADGALHDDLGLRIVATDEAFELWSRRASYDEPVTTVWRSPAGEVPLPAGTMPDLATLEDFVSVTFAQDGETVATEVRDVCVSYRQEPRRRDARSRSPYPGTCRIGSYALGSVHGLPAGWSSTLASYDLGSPGPAVPAGRYHVTARITPRYASAFGLSEAQATRTMTVTVLDDEDASPVERDRGTIPGRTTDPVDRHPAGPALPNLRPLPPQHVVFHPRSDLLEFDGTVWNAGAAPLVIRGARRGDDARSVPARQLLVDARGRTIGSRAIGSLRWPGQHRQAWRYAGLQRYRLLGPDGRAVAADTHRPCLRSTTPVDMTGAGADWRERTARSTTGCHARSLRAVLAPGWGDETEQGAWPRRAFDLRGLPNGTYTIVVTANPGRRLRETSTADNVVRRQIVVGGRPGHRTVRAAPVGIVDEHH